MTDRDSLWGREVSARNFGIHLSNFCNIECAHCLYSSGRTEAKQTIPLEWVEALCQVMHARSPGIPMVITGGEPFAFREQLRAICAIGASYGFPITVHSNGFWGRRSSMATFLAELSSLGVHRLNLSFDDFHRPFLNGSTLAAAIAQAREASMKVRLLLVEARGARIRIDNIADFLGMDPKDLPELDAGDLGRYGRADSLQGIHYHKHSLERYRDMGCPALYQPLLYSDGEMAPCCGPAFTDKVEALVGERLVSRIDPSCPEASIGRLLDDWTANPVFRILHFEGPYGLWKRAQAALEPEDRTLLPQTTSDICTFCLDVTQHPRVREILRNQSPAINHDARN